MINNCKCFIQFVKEAVNLVKTLIQIHNNYNHGYFLKSLQYFVKLILIINYTEIDMF